MHVVGGTSTYVTMKTPFSSKYNGNLRIVNFSPKVENCGKIQQEKYSEENKEKKKKKKILKTCSCDQTMAYFWF